MKTLFAAAALALAVAAATIAADHPDHAAAPAATPGVREFTSVNIEYKGSKVWVPSVFIVKKGDKVKLTLINNAPSGVHGFAIDEFGIKVAVNNDEKDNKKVVEFTAEQPGLYRTYCHMHPAHVGGQILVVD
ncbi:MAG: cupredoxin domain-containing protein [Elusimicrobia bacterium]|nr:cupredoxin domain-containing protein [Elusimicrobiota bacterium]